jgi:hypothetical protein
MKLDRWTTLMAIKPLLCTPVTQPLSPSILFQSHKFIIHDNCLPPEGLSSPQTAANLSSVEQAGNKMAYEYSCKMMTHNA